MNTANMEEQSARLILLDGGDAGGLYLDATGVHTLPPLAPAILAQLRGVANLLRSAQDEALDEHMGQELNALLTRVSNLAIERVEAAVGPLAGEDALVYLEYDDGFICGSTGAPPRPLPWPTVGSPSLPDLSQHNQLTAEVSNFLSAASAAGVATADVFEDPNATAEKLGFRLSEHAAASLRQVAPSQLESITDPVSREVVELYHKVAADGRFIDRWTAQPAAVAESLGAKLSVDAIDRILGSAAITGGPVSTPEVVTDVVIIVGVLLTLRPGGIIEDRSGQPKF